MEVAMLERFFLKPQTMDRILGCWLGPRIESYVTILCKQGYSARTILRRVPILVDFAGFTKAKGVEEIAQAAPLVDEFVADQLSASRSGYPADSRRRDQNLLRVTVRQFFTLAVSESEYRPARKPWVDPFATQAPGFFEYLRAERGLRQSSIHSYQHYLRRFENYLAQVGCQEVGSLALCRFRRRRPAITR
jgi:site-specific recombinase XerD